MIKKSNSFPLRLFALKALARRLSHSEELKSRITEEVRIVQAGINGEKTLARIFERYTFPGSHFVFHDMNLRSTGAFQIDTLFLSEQGATILEVKNIAGKIHFPPEQNQMMRTLDNGQVDVFECPSIQLARNKLLLGDWFQSNNLDIPIQTAVVFANPRQHFDNFRENLKVLFPLEVPVYLREVMEASPFLTIPTMNNVAEKLVVANRNYDPFPLNEKYKFDWNHIMKGVHCVQCGVHGMRSVTTGWACKSCNYLSKDAHKQAIIEYFMLFGGLMTNRSCREFLLLQSSDKAKRLLRQMNIPFNGVNKGRTYHLPMKIMEKQLDFLREK